MNDTGFLLLHGAGLGAWIWKDVISGIHAPYVAADFPYRTGTQAERNALTFDDYVQAVMDQAATLQTAKVVVVAHSLSGTVALKVAAQLGERLAGFIAVGAAIPKNGASYAGSTGFWRAAISSGVALRIATAKLPNCTSSARIGRFNTSKRPIVSMRVPKLAIVVPSTPVCFLISHMLCVPGPNSTHIRAKLSAIFSVSSACL